MNLTSIASLAAAVIASSAWAAEPAQKKCGAGTCGKKEVTCQKDDKSDKCATAPKDAGCSKKEASCSKKEASCSKKDAACSKK